MSDILVTHYFSAFASPTVNLIILNIKYVVIDYEYIQKLITSDINTN